MKVKGYTIGAGANLEEADLSETNLSKAILTRANLTWAKLENTDLSVSVHGVKKATWST